MLFLLIFIFGTVGALFMAYSIGANDVANAFGTSVGAKVLTLRQAVVLAGIFEFAGSVLMGSHVSDTIRKGIVNVELFVDQPTVLMLGMFSSLISAGIWLLIATFFRLPVSTTHSIIGAILGFVLAIKGGPGVNWVKIGLVVASWVISPILSGFLSSSMFYSVKKYILKKDNPAERAVNAIPYLFGFTMGVNCFFVIYKGSPGLGLDDTPLWIGIIITIGVIVLSGIVGQLILVPFAHRRMRRKRDIEAPSTLLTDTNSTPVPPNTPTSAEMVVVHPHNVPSSPANLDAGKLVEISLENEPEITSVVAEIPSNVKGNDNTTSSDTKLPGILAVVETNPVASLPSADSDPEIHVYSEIFNSDSENTFSILQVITACFAAFSHGSNDLANSIGPYAAIYSIYKTGMVLQENPVPVWMLMLGGGGIVIGLATLGHRVIETIGKNVTKITPSRGFTIELGAAMAVVGASRVGIPVSTSHCQVGSVVGVGRVDGHKAIDWKLFCNIVISWLVTLPFAGIVSALIYYFLAWIIL